MAIGSGSVFRGNYPQDDNRLVAFSSMSVENSMNTLYALIWVGNFKVESPAKGLECFGLKMKPCEESENIN